MRIALVRRGYSATGGAERYLQRFATGLAVRGHEPVLLSDREWPKAAWMFEQYPSLGGSTPKAFAHSLDRARHGLDCEFLFSLERVRRCDAYRAGDGVHRAWLDRRRAAGAWLPALVREWQPRHRELMALERELFSGRGAPRIIVNSRLVAREIHEYFRVSQDRIRLVYNGYDLPLHESTEDPAHGRANVRRLLGVPEEALLVLFTGSGWERKGLGYLTSAARELDRRNLYVVVAGSGKMRPAYRVPRVIFPGPVHDMAPLYEAADLFVLPTLYDPFSNACLEAMRHGLPVLTSKANGFSEIGCDGVHGEAFEPGCAESVMHVLDRWTDPGHPMPERALCAALVAPYTVDANVRQTLDALGLA